MSFKKALCILSVFFFLFSGIALAQTAAPEGKIVAFHPSAGNFITLDEKKEFGLFPEYNDSLFESAELVKYDSTKYTMLMKTKNGQSFERAITLAELDAIYSKIESAKPVVKANPPANNTDERKLTPEQLRKKEERADTAEIIAQTTFEIIFVLLSIWAK